MRQKDRKQAVTMYEIARLAGVSQSTVSRVLNGKTPVAPEKQAAVLEVMERLNYHPNTAAQELVSGKTSTIGILTRDLGSPFFGEMLSGTAKGMQESNYYPVIGFGGDTSIQEQRAVELLLARRIDGLIIQASKHLSNEYLRKTAEIVPLILIGRLVRGIEKQCVVVNNTHGAYVATSYLIDKGHTIIAHVSGRSNVADAVERQDGYCRALEDHGISIIPELIVEADYSEASGALAAERLLSKRKKYPFTAIFAANDQSAVGVRLSLYHRGLNVPDDISLVGFDDLSTSQYMIPPLTTVRQPAFYMGVVAAQAMLASLAGESFHLTEFPLELVVRQSVAIR